ncbi:MAG: serine hydrolase [Planctomycetes bacterium]|nr:serine hydrolase [Planctomycetota bacterium]
MAAAPPLALVPLLCTPLLAQREAAPSRELAEVVAAYAAKVAASAIFVSGRRIESVLAEEFAPTRPLEALVRPMLKFHVDRTAGTVACDLGQAQATAVFTPGLGCTLAVAPMTVAALRARTALPAPVAEPRPWPRGDVLPPEPIAGVDHKAVAAALAAAFAEPDPQRRRVTRAIVVVYDGHLIAERYADGYHAAMPLPGWSMTKTLAYTLFGMRGTPLPPVAEWADDGRRAITTDHLLQMTAGLAWNESYDDAASDVLRMLFAGTDHAATYVARPSAEPPGTRFHYTSGATNLLCRQLRRTFADDASHLAFPRTALFDKLGMHGTVLEPDASGTFVGSSYGFATARDWARLGMLWCDLGEFAGERVVARSWLEAAWQPAPGSNGRFGRHLWLETGPGLPADTACMHGHEGQACAVVRSHKLVVVRLGCTKNGGFDLHALLRDLLAALPR